MCNRSFEIIMLVFKSFIGFIYLWNLFLRKNSYLFVLLFNVLFLKSRGFKISANNMSFTCLPLCIFPQPSTLSCLLILFIVGPRIWLVFCERNNWFIHVLLMTVSFQFYISQDLDDSIEKKIFRLSKSCRLIFGVMQCVSCVEC